MKTNYTTKELKEKLSLLNRFDPSGIENEPELDKLGDYMRVEDIEELFNIKL